MDRVVEVDLDVIGRHSIVADARRLVHRLAPLWRGPSPGTRGLVVNTGWLMDLVTEWSGAPAQPLPLRSARLAPWAEATYDDLAEVVDAIRSAAAEEGVAHLRVGPLVLGIGQFVNEIVRLPDDEDDAAGGAATPLYDERSAWFERHPELFPFPVRVTLHGPGLDLRVPLAGDRQSYATRPDGCRAGESFTGFFADQWASLSRAVGFDLLLLRDETTTPVHAGRLAFDGSRRPATAEEVADWTGAVVRWTSDIKAAAPGTHLMLYSSGLSPTVERRLGRLDVAAVVAAGHVDAWVDQTWGGAWQDWWDAGWQGWTFQLANLAARAALVRAGNRERATPCVHHKLVQLLDGWEPYDTFHDHPDKLRWGIWAMSHAAAVDVDGTTHVPQGTYLAVANDRTGRLLEQEEVRWVADTLDEAERSSEAMTDVLGPVMVLQPGHLDDRTTGNASEWVEDYVGFLSKWGLPVLGATTDTTARREGAVVQVPCADVDGAGGPLLLTGRADLLAPAAARRAGLAVVDGPLAPAGYAEGRSAAGVRLRPLTWPYLPVHARVTPSTVTDTLYEADGTAVVTRREAVLWWQPPDVADPADRRLTHYQIGAVEPHYTVAHTMALLARQAGGLALHTPALHEPVTCHGWWSGGVLHVLLGNVESGWLGDSRFTRRVTVALPTADPRWPTDAVADGPDGVTVDVSSGRVDVVVPAEGMVLLTVRSA